jgi:class 3 adenylate cyclase/predicted ATPase
VDIEAWLRGLGLEHYAQAFRDNAIDGEILPKLTADDLKDIGVTIVGHRRRMLEAIATLRAAAEPTPSPAAETRPAPTPDPRPASPLQAERRQLTVMFIDLVGSTVLSTRLDPEEMGEVLRAYQDAVAGEVLRWEGHVAKFMGDGVLAYFGWPKAHEDDAERAVRAGLAITEAVAGLPARGGETLAARVGIATGLVVVGDLVGQGAAREEAVVGETPNRAARLQQLARPGTVVVGEPTRRLVGGLFELEELPAPALKGFAGPQRAYLVLGEGLAESRFEALHGLGLTPLVGREHELALLLERWDRAKDGEGQVVLLGGEPGIGKSRLLRALRERLADEPCLPLSHYCSPFHQASALHPVIDLLERAAGFARDDTPAGKLDKLEALLARGTADLAGAAPLVAALLSVPTADRYPPLDLTPRRQKERTLEVLVDQVAGLARREPVLALYEDVHWADPTTLEALDLVIDRARTLRALVVVTFRPEFAPRWTGDAHVNLLTLSRLGRRQGAAMVEQVTGGKALPPEVLEQIVEHTDGVPLFVEELTKAVLELGLLEEGAGGYTLAGPLPPLAIPSTLRDSLMARLDRRAPVREVAQVGAVIGREFSHELLAAVAGLPEAELDHATEQLVTTGLVFRRGGPAQAVYLFKHALVQDAAYGSLLISRRQQLHARIAQVLEERFPETAETEPELLAHHFGQAGLAEEAVDYHERAGRRALARSALAEALAQFGAALARLQDLPRAEGRLRRELALRLALGSGHVAAHGFAAPATGEAYRRAIELCEELGDARELFPVLYGLGLYYLYAAELSEARAVAERLLSLAETDDDRGLSFFAHRAAGVSALPAGDFAGARSHLERALELYDPGEHRSPAFVYAFDPRVVCLDYLARTLLPLGFPRRALAANEEAIGEARRLSHQNSLALPLFFGGVLRQVLGDRAGVEALSGELARIAADAGFRLWQAGASILRGWTLAEAGERAAGGLEIRRGIDEWRATGAEYMVPYFLALSSRVELGAGRPEAALKLLEEARARVERTGERWFSAEILRLEGEANLALGRDRLARAKACFARALETAAGQGARLWELRAALSLARVEADDAGLRGRLGRLCATFGDGSGPLPELEAARALAPAAGLVTQAS